MFTNHVLHTLYLVVRVVTCFVIYGHKTQVVTNENHYLLSSLIACPNSENIFVLINQYYIFASIYALNQMINETNQNRIIIKVNRAQPGNKQ